MHAHRHVHESFRKFMEFIEMSHGSFYYLRWIVMNARCKLKSMHTLSFFHCLSVSHIRFTHSWFTKINLIENTTKCVRFQIIIEKDSWNSIFYEKSLFLCLYFLSRRNRNYYLPLDRIFCENSFVLCSL